MSNKRVVEAFGHDVATSEKSLKRVAAGGVPKSFNDGDGDKRGNRLTDESTTGSKKRVVRAFHDQPRSKLGKLQKDHERGSEAERQNAETGEVMLDGGNSSGRIVKPVFPSIVDAFQGRSGQPDNQNTFRNKGST